MTGLFSWKGSWQETLQRNALSNSTCSLQKWWVSEVHRFWGYYITQAKYDTCNLGVYCELRNICANLVPAQTPLITIWWIDIRFQIPMTFFNISLMTVVNQFRTVPPASTKHDVSKTVLRLELFSTAWQDGVVTKVMLRKPLHHLSKYVRSCNIAFNQ